MLKDNQVWENKSKIAKVEENGSGLQAVVFKIKPDGLLFDDIVCSKDVDLEKFLKKSRMQLTDKVLAIE